MPFLTDAEIKERYGPSKDEVTDYLKKHRLKNTRAYRALAVRRLTASKIKKALGKEISGLESNGNWRVIYGRARVGGTISFLHTTNNNEQLHIVVTVAGHEIEEIEKLYLDEQEVLFSSNPIGGWSTSIRDNTTNVTRNASNKIFLAVNNGNPSNPAIPELIANCPNKWDSRYRQRGRAHVYIILKWDAVLFPNGIPEISFLVKGKKCYDPRDGTTYWTRNAALQALDYLTNTQYGLGASLSECETTTGKAGNWKAAADVCQQSVSLSGGGTEARYTGNGSFEIGESHQTNLETILSAMAGTLTYANGKWKCWPAKWYGAAIYLSEEDIIGELQIVTKISRRDNFNAVKGTYVSPEANYEETDFPAVKNDFYKQQDNNEEIYEDIQLPFTTSPATAQRIAKIHLEQIRQPITVELTAKLKAFQVEPGEAVYLSWSRLGWVNKTFEVDEAELLFDISGDNPTCLVRLSLRESAAGVYAWNGGEETTVDVAPNTTLPNPFSVVAPTGITIQSGTSELYVRADGTIFSRMKVSWTTNEDSFVTSGGQIEAQYRIVGSSAWLPTTPVAGDFDYLYILDVKDTATYEVRLRAKSVLGVYSAWSNTATHTVIGKTEPPGTVQGLQAQIQSYGVSLQWDALPDLDISHYHIKYGATGVAWGNAISLGEVAGTSKTTQLQAAGEYSFLIKGYDTSGNESATAATIAVIITAPTAPNVSFTITGPNVLLTWTASEALFAIREYEIRYGATFATATTETSTRALSLLTKATWSGVRKYWVAARDVAGNLGEPASIDINISAPSIVNNPLVDVVDNNVLIKWSAPTSSTIPIETYKIYKGATFSGATLVGQTAGTFSALFEIISGTFTYWIVPVNTAGTAGAETSVTAKVDEPPDYVILEETALPGSVGTLTNAYILDDDIYLGINTTETWADHFVNNSWSTPQDQIDAGYPYYLQPTLSTGKWEKVIDYGSLLDPSLIKLSYSFLQITGTTTVTAKIAYSTDNVTYTSANATTVYAQSYRYVRITLEKP
jgi:hypothetical protein